MTGSLRKKILDSNYLNYWIVLGIDIFVSMLSTLFSTMLTRHFVEPRLDMNVGLSICMYSLLSSFLAFYIFKVYKNIIRHSNLRDVWRICAAVVLKMLMMVALLKLCNIAIANKQMLGGVLFDALLTLCGLIIVRVLMVLVYDMFASRISNRTNIMIYGVEDPSVSLATRITYNKQYHICGFYLYGDNYRSFRIGNYRTYYFNNEDDFKYLKAKLNIKAVAFPSYSTLRSESQRLVKYCIAQKVKVMIAPPVDEVTNDTIKRTPMREIRIEDLLGRDEIQISMDEIVSNFKGTTILVTGAAGSIGSELCRQLALFGVRKLILYDSAETPTHNIRLELENRFPNLQFVPVVGDVRMKGRLEQIFKQYKPQTVFHAAAYKHVPLMEENPCEAILANVLGTRNVADLCVQYQVGKMVMISTDKAVNPTNVMGASKRLAEIYVQSLGLSIAHGEIKGITKFITTRFGNVLGSNGSVIPRFREQIQTGGPITVTHPEIMRFFMTIPEACKLVMEAATMGNGNEIFVFDMGEPVKIVDMARKMIELAGLEPDKDIKIVFSGLRPGEKLYEEVLADSENTLPTSHKKILIAKVREYAYHDIESEFLQLVNLARSNDEDSTVIKMKSIVPEYISEESRFSTFDKKVV